MNQAYGIERIIPGILLDELMEAFGTSYSSTSGVFSVQMGIVYCVGLITGGLIKKFGCRKITVVGTIIAAIGYITSGFAQNIATLYLTIFCTGKFCLPGMGEPSLSIIMTVL